jgi:hypothetical protein
MQINLENKLQLNFLQVQEQMVVATTQIIQVIIFCSLVKFLYLVELEMDDGL